MERLIFINRIILFTYHYRNKPIYNNRQFSKDIKQHLGGTVAVAVYNANTNTSWSYHGEQRVPIMSTFKALVCSNLLHQADTKRVNLNQSIMIKQSDILSYAPITANRVGTSMTLAQLCNTTMLTSDNTTANLILTNICGPQSVTQFISTLNDKTPRIDRIEPEVNNVSGAELRDPPYRHEFYFI
ncbi:serine hydrolase [Photobacterium sp. S4TG1]|uniref:serine hydrolase n=1 Tax=Photobacterium sp. S4TG1 TaxID=3114587 RepID=UPI002E172E9D|nr:serine hydrolase [Photobacterium sp. S4TG1]